MNQQKPLLSIGMIFKNEIRCLERCMKSLLPLREAIPCELVMVDTGSDDGSRELAEQYADLLIDFPWIDDFSAARNAGLERCTGKWFFFLDADEWLGDDISGLIRFLREENGKYNGASLLIRNYVSCKNMEQYSDFFGGRFLRLSTGGRFENPVHENFAKYANPMVMLQNVMLHHDGYVKDDPELIARKKGRNEPLLQKKLEQNPRDLITYVQIMAQNLPGEEQYATACKAVALIEEGQGEKHQAEPVIYSQAVEAAARYGKVDQMLQWLRTAEERYPDSIYVRIDAHAAACAKLYAEKRYEEALECGQCWEEGLQAYSRSDFDVRELTLSALSYAIPSSQCGVYATLFDCLCKLERWEEAQEYLGKLDLEYLEEENWKAMIHLMFAHGEHFPSFGRILFVVWNYINERLTEDEKWPHCRSFLWSNMNKAFSKAFKLTCVHRAIAALPDCEPGRSARICLADGPEDIRRELAQIRNWDEVFYMAYPPILAADIELPPSFYARGTERIAETATHVAQSASRLSAILLSQKEETYESYYQVAWRMNLVAAVCRLESTWEDAEQGEAICKLFLAYARQHLETVYHPSVLQEESIALLPGLCRFAWYCIQANRSLEQGDEVGYVRNLRLGLENAPGMKRMVEFQIERMEERKCQNVSPELLELADKVRTILAQYPPYDPAVLALKQSEAYQKVAYLIEGMEAPIFGGLSQ